VFLFVPFRCESPFLVFFVVCFFCVADSCDGLGVLPAYFLWRVSFSDRQMVLVVAIAVVASLLVSESVLRLFGSMGGFVGDKIAQYLDMGGDPTLTAGGGDLTLRAGLIRGFSHRALVFVVSLWALRRVRREDRTLNAIYNIYMFSIVLYLLTAPFSLVLARVANYYDYFLVLVIPAIVRSLAVRSDRVIVFLILAGYLLVRFQGAYDSRPEFFAPYKSIFNKEKVI
jgi:hypothetical protein